MNPSSILVYSEELNERVKYAFRLIFTSILGIDVRFTNQINEIPVAVSPVVNYSIQNFTGTLRIIPVGLLNEKGIRDKNPSVFEWNNLPVFFETNPAETVPFDLFAAAFFLASRYEEYLHFKPDNHGRFRAEDSFTCKNGFLQLPVINLWVMELKKIMEAQFPEFRFPETRYQFIPTIDIDIAYAYRQHSLSRTFGGFLKSFFTGEFKILFQRAKVIAGFEKDPYDTYEEFDSIHDNKLHIPIYFLSVGDYGPYNKNHSHRNKAFKKLVSRLSCKNKTGLHPSYYSSENTELIETEKKRVEWLLHRKITASRQHYLKLNLPKTYRALIKAGIKKDFSLGYASKPGFRAGICTPFYWYDLLSEHETSLELWSFQVMDGTLNHYMKLKPDEAIKIVEDIVGRVKKVNGVFISLWHNVSISEINEWAGWKKVYKKLVEIAEK